MYFDWAAAGDDCNSLSVGEQFNQVWGTIPTKDSEKSKDKHSNIGVDSSSMPRGAGIQPDLSPTNAFQQPASPKRNANVNHDTAQMPRLIAVYCQQLHFYQGWDL